MTPALWSDTKNRQRAGEKSGWNQGCRFYAGSFTKTTVYWDVRSAAGRKTAS